MPTTYDGADTFPASLTIPSDGDTRDAASVNVATEGLADRTKYLRNRIPGAATSVTYVVPLGAPYYNSGGRWTVDSGANAMGFVQNDVASVADGRWILPLPPSGTVTEVAVFLDGNGGGTGHGALPAEMPIAYVRTLNAGGDLDYDAVASQVDTSASVALYHTVHDVAVALSYAIDTGGDVALVLEVHGEGDTNSAANALVLGPFARITVTP